MAGTAARIGGLFGVASALVIIPAYVVGSPDAPKTGSDAARYFAEASMFLTANGTLPHLHLLFALIFIGVLVSVLHSAAGPSGAVYIAAIGGAVFVTLTAAGLAAEVAIPASIVQFDDVGINQFAQPFLTLAIYLYHFSHIGSAALIFATAYVIWTTGVLPKSAAALGILGIPALLHVFIGLPSAYAMIAWLGLSGLALLVLPFKAPLPESIGV